MRNSRFNYFDFSLFDNKSFNSFQNDINIKNNKNINKMNKLFTFKENIENENENNFQVMNDSNEIFIRLTQIK
jgi:hypothetical protein